MKTLVEFAADYLSNQANRLYEAYKPIGGSADHFMKIGREYLRHKERATAIDLGDRNDDSSQAWNDATKALNMIYRHYGKNTANEVQSADTEGELVSIGKQYARPHFK